MNERNFSILSIHAPYRHPLVSDTSSLGHQITVSALSHSTAPELTLVGLLIYCIELGISSSVLGLAWQAEIFGFVHLYVHCFNRPSMEKLKKSNNHSLWQCFMYCIPKQTWLIGAFLFYVMGPNKLKLEL